MSSLEVYKARFIRCDGTHRNDDSIDRSKNSKSPIVSSGKILQIQIYLYYIMLSTFRTNLLMPIISTIKPVFNCKVRIPGTVKCRPTVAY